MSWLSRTRGSSRVGRYPAAVAEERTEHLTQAQKEQLEAELAELEGPRRAEIVDAIRVARGYGDLSENFEYHAAKNEQGMLERRITILRDRLDRSVIIDEAAAAASDTVSVGSKVEIEDDAGERMEVEISSVGGVSPDSPLGSALLGAKVGDEVDIAAPRGSWRAKVVSIGR
jgi:transcription elongation factor GreA